MDVRQTSGSAADGLSARWLVLPGVVAVVAHLPALQMAMMRERLDDPQTLLAGRWSVLTEVWRQVPVAEVVPGL